MPYYATPSTTGIDPEHAFANHVVYLAARDARSSLTPNDTQRTTLIVAACYVVAIAILWYVANQYSLEQSSDAKVLNVCRASEGMYPI